nr:hypothetical protein [Tanacetum cinerariifolium]
TSPLPPSPVIPSSPPHQSPRLPPPQAVEGSSILVQQVLDTCSALVLRVEGLESANTSRQLEILKLKARVKKLEKLNKVQEAVEIVTTAKLMTEVVTAAATQVVDATTPIPTAKPKYIRRYHGYKKKPQSESEARKNMIAYLKNTEVDEDDDVFIEATPIGRKVPIVNYKIVMINNKPRYKIIRADDTHQLY